MAGILGTRAGDQERREITSDDVMEADTSSIMGAHVKKNEQGPTMEAGATGFGKLINLKNPTGAHIYEPHSGTYIDPVSGHAGSLTRDVVIDEKSALKHEKAGERAEKLENPACDHSRMSARIKVHGATTCPYVSGSAENNENETGFNISDLDRIVTSGLTETAELSFQDMAACALGIVDVQTDPIVAIPEIGPVSRTGSADITELPKTSTLLRKTHIIPELLDSVEDNGVRIGISFGDAEVFNGMIIDRGEMLEAPVVKLVKTSESQESELFLLLLIELEAGNGRTPQSEEDYLQWMVKNLTPECRGTELVRYSRMMFSNKDRHKHVFLLFKHKQGLQLDETSVPPAQRNRFNLQDFIVRHGLGAAVAAVYFESETC